MTTRTTPPTPAAQLTELLAADGRFTLDRDAAGEAIESLELDTPVHLLDGDAIRQVLDEIGAVSAIASPHPAWEMTVIECGDWLMVSVENWAANSGGAPFLRLAGLGSEIHKLVERDVDSLDVATWLDLVDEFVARANHIVDSARQLTAPAA